MAEINRTIEDLLVSLKTKEEWLNEGNTLSGLKRYPEVLAAYEQAIRLNPDNAFAYNKMGNALRDLKRYPEALAAFEQAIRLDPNFAILYYNKGCALESLGKKQEAQQAYKRARKLGYTG